MKKVIPFPQARSKRVKALMKTEAQRLFLSMSLFSLILVAVFSNDHLMSSQRPVYLISDNTNPLNVERLNRAIASAQPV